MEKKGNKQSACISYFLPMQPLVALEVLRSSYQPYFSRERISEPEPFAENKVMPFRSLLITSKWRARDSFRYLILKLYSYLSVPQNTSTSMNFNNKLATSKLPF